MFNYAVRNKIIERIVHMILDELLAKVKNKSISVDEALNIFDSEKNSDDKSKDLIFITENIEKLTEVNSNNKQNILLFDKKSDLHEELAKNGNNITRVIIDDHSSNNVDLRCELNENAINELLKNKVNLSDYTAFVFRIDANGFTADINIIKEKIKECISPILILLNILKEVSIKKEVKIFVCFDTSDDMPDPIVDAVSAFVKTVNLEFTKINMKWVRFVNTSLSRKAEILDDLNNDYYKNIDSIICNEKLYRTVNKESTESTDKNSVWFKDKGVYLITGGISGLGYKFAELISKKVSSPVLILCGRRNIDESINRKLAALTSNNALVEYIKADISKEDQAEILISSIIERYGCVNGVIHSAGVINDNYIVNKRWDEFNKTLLPKVYGVINLGEKLSSQKLDFFVVFSSIVSLYGNAGQCDYSYANRFMDSYIKYRNKMNYSGRSIAINWPFWNDGGMKLDDKTIRLMNNTSKLYALEDAEGFSAFEYVLTKTNAEQLLVVKGKKEDVYSSLNLTENAIKKSKSVKKEIDLSSKVAEKLCEGVASILNIDINEIYLDMDISEFGFDSITFTELSNYLYENFNINVLPSVFFEYSSLNSLKDYIIDEYKDELIKNLCDDEVSEVLKENFEDGQKAEITELLMENAPDQDDDEIIEENTFEHYNNEELEPIAIIGMSGVFPKSDDLDEYWQNLVDSSDLITEIPKDRWDWRKYYSEENEDNKTSFIHGGFINDVDKFDADFFGLSPREAELMDPQHRLFLQSVWKTVENAGYKMSSLAGSNTGLFVGVTTLEYDDLLREACVPVQAQTSTGIAHSILANRISYLFDWHGPSEPIDTACSSSLVAIHHAVNALRNKECDVAVAGGVNIILTPKLFISFGKAGMLAPDGKCKPFDKDANGYVRGEGCGSIMLKPLSKAKRDKDNIFAVIRNTGTNHGGHVNSLTTPNPNAQAELIKNTWQEIGISPSTITYMETHGTGTSLGDPIEVNGLKKAFDALYKQNNENPKINYCGIGSVKSNIGHLEGASGIAGLLKVVMAMQKGVIPKNMNFNELNPYINLTDSPFYVVDKLTEWKNLRDDNNRIIPRRAGISSMGFGGMNAHVALEEFISDSTAENTTVSMTSIHIIPLSANSISSLKKKAEELLEYIDKDDSDISRIAYTLQTGRESMKYRCAFPVCDKEELKNKLRELINGGIDLLNIKKIKNTGNKKIADNSVINKLIQKNDFDMICEIWNSGEEIEWESLYGNNVPNKLVLPSYPFEKNHFWIETQNIINGIMPLVDKNESDLNYVKYSKCFSDNFVYIKDHVVNGAYVVPGAMFIDMAFEGITLADNLHKYNTISNVLFKSMAVIDAEPQKFNTFFNFKNNSIHCSIENDQSKQVYFEAVLSNRNIDANIVFEGFSKKKDMLEKNVDEFYTHLGESGLDYGEKYRTVKKIYANNNESLAFVKLNDEDIEYMSATIIPFTLLDAAFQSLASICENEDAKGTYIPFEIGNMTKYRDIPNECYVYSKLKRTDKELIKVDIVIADETGKVCVTVSDFVSRATYADDKPYNCLIDSELIHAPVVGNENNEKFILVYDSEKFIENIGLSNDEYVKCNLNSDVLKNVVSETNGVNKIVLAFDDSFNNLINCEKQLKKSIYLIADLIQIYKKNLFVMFLFKTSSDSNNPVFSSVGAFGRSIMQENESIKIKTIELQDSELALKSIIRSEFGENEFNAEVLYKSNARYVKKYSLRELELSDKKASAIKNNGVYIITGGMGGVGFLMGKYLVNEYNAKVYLVGRRNVDTALQQKIKAIGENAKYIQADIAVLDDVKNLFNEIENDGNNVNGILHCAGNIRDSYICDKDKKDIEAVLGPKILGTLCLLEVAKSKKLDFVMLFSSTAQIFGNAGQSDYAFANRFMANIAEMYKSSDSTPIVSVDWPLWKNGGMNVSDSVVKMLKCSYGMLPLENDNAFKVFEYSLNKKGKISFMYGDKNKINRVVLSNNVSDVNTDINVKKQLSLEKKSNKTNISEDVKNIVSKILKISVKNIESDELLKEYGFDSITFTEFANMLNEKYDLDLRPSVFYEYTTLDELIEFLQGEIKENDDEIQIMTENYTPEDLSSDSEIGETRNVNYKREVSSDISEPKESDEIAIVGLSCMMPHSDDAQEYWQHLINGDNMSEVIPEDRWDWKEYFGNNSEKNKTNVKYGCFMKDVRSFDEKFFGISPREANLLDPQHRLMMQQVWKAIDDAGIKVSSLSGTRTGVFIGVSTSDYTELLTKNNIDVQPQTSTGSAHSMLANRISYMLNINGPSEPINTACSSSLVAVHRAVMSIMNNESEMAIVGGVNVILSPSAFICFGKSGMLSEDGKCKTFDRSADGYVRGEGCGAIILMPLSKALKNKCHIYGIIKGSAVNHGGSASSLTAPNARMQVDVIKNAWLKTGFDPSTVSYIEAHGTGTALGDPVEVNSLVKAFSQLQNEYKGEKTVEKLRCAIGAVKSNIGHLEAASGMAGIIKVLLSMKHKVIPANVNFHECNPEINIEGSGFFIPKENEVWNRECDIYGNEVLRRAGISSFGYGGANAHIVIEEYPQISNGNAHNSGTNVIIPVSAKCKESLYGYLEDLNRFLSDNENIDINDIAYTLQLGRNQYNTRVLFLVKDIAELKEQISVFLKEKQESTGVYVGTDENIDWVFKSDSGIENDFIRMLIEKNEYRQLCKLWVNGVNIDWSLLEPVGKRVTLPTYYFLKNPHWFCEDNKDVKTADLTQKPILQVKKDIVVSEYSGNEVEMEVLPQGIALVKMCDKASKNSLTDQLVSGLIYYFEKIRNNKDIKVVILTGYDNYFCMGGTKEQLLKINEKKMQCNEVPFLYKGLLELDIPVISAMQGHAAGAGLALGLCADIVIMSLNGSYQASFMRYGFTPGMGSTYVLERKLGYNIAMELMYTARGLSGNELKEKGAPIYFYKREDVLNEALRIAGYITDKSVHSLNVLKHDLAEKEIENVSSAIIKEVGMHNETFSDDIVKERINELYNTTNIPTNVEPQKQAAVSHLEKQVSDINVKEKLEKIITRILQNNTEDINSNITFKEMGVDSIIGVEIIRELNQAFNIKLEAIELYNYPTIETLAKYIQGILPSESQKKVEPIKKISTVETTKIRLNNLNKERAKDEDDISGKIQLTPKRDRSDAIENHEKAKAKEKPSIKFDNIKSNTDVTNMLKTILSKVVGINPNDIKNDEVFKDLGVDSILTVELVREVNLLWGIGLEAVDIYDNPSINSLSLFIASKLEQTVSQSPVEAKKHETAMISEILPKAYELRKILSDILCVPESEIELNDKFSEMGLNQVEIVSFISEIKKRYSVEIQDYELIENSINSISILVDNSSNDNSSDESSDEIDMKIEELIMQFKNGEQNMDEVKHSLEDLF